MSNIGIAIINCCLVKKPNAVMIIAKNKYFNLQLKDKILRDVSNTKEKRKFVRVSGKTPVDEKTNMGLKDMVNGRIINKMLFFGKMYFDIWKQTPIVARNIIADITRMAQILSNILLL